MKPDECMGCSKEYDYENCEFFINKTCMALKKTKDNIQQPIHYTTGPIECIDAIRSALTPEEFRGYCKGNILKYTWREKLKGGDEDLKKALQYLKFIGIEK